MTPTAKGWVDLFTNLKDTLEYVVTTLSQDNDADIDSELKTAYDQIFYITYQMYILKLKNIHILPDREIRELKACRKEGRLIDSRFSDTAVILSNLLILLKMIDEKAEEVIISLL